MNFFSIVSEHIDLAMSIKDFVVYSTLQNQSHNKCTATNPGVKLWQDLCKRSIIIQPDNFGNFLVSSISSYLNSSTFHS